MASTSDLSEQFNHLEDQETNIASTSMTSDDPIDSEEKLQEQVPSCQAEENEIKMTDNNNNDELTQIDPLPTMNAINMVTAEASFTEATSADLPLGATRSSVARILVKPGQIFRVQVDNEVKEVHGKLIYFHCDDNYTRQQEIYCFN
ncbi:unnamed protein product [Adineta ricciae]|uniref:Uncharacterized protein n=1 Tax=Adineta ricciae TaxID=249248 RepID=A0A816FD93_ADIRI|nr:unnamed protein product [Adineta ricciae]CAF1659807.1 unnamed protein product [Adineta ricciae]